MPTAARVVLLTTPSTPHCVKGRPLFDDSHSAFDASILRARTGRWTSRYRSIHGFSLESTMRSSARFSLVSDAGRTIDHEPNSRLKVRPSSSVAKFLGRIG
jgi:hypothetical protein